MVDWTQELLFGADVGAISDWLHQVGADVVSRQWETETTIIALEAPTTTKPSPYATVVGFNFYLFTKVGFDLPDGTHRPAGSGQYVDTPIITFHVQYNHPSSSRVIAKCYEPNLADYFHELLDGLRSRFPHSVGGHAPATQTPESGEAALGEPAPTTRFSKVADFASGSSKNVDEVHAEGSSRAALSFEGQREAVRHYWGDKAKGLFDDEYWDAEEKTRMTQDEWAKKHYAISGRTLRRYIRNHPDLRPKEKGFGESS